VKPIYINHQHEAIVQSYLDTIFDSVREVVIEDSKYNDFIDIANVIIDYHNQYSEHKNIGNFDDFLMIIPINFSTMVSGFFCGYENKSNATRVKIHRHLLSEFGLHVCKDLKKLKPIDGSN
tara:strand:- start:198 stop:560 length:363 start_codon:yes stop_codon:yes gene_type:complete